MKQTGEYIQDELTARGWTRDWLAYRAELSKRTVDRLLRGECRVTRRTAIGLARAFGTSAKLWSNLQAAFDEMQRRTTFPSAAALACVAVIEQQQQQPERTEP